MVPKAAFGLAVLMILATAPVFAQGFMVKPMKLEAPTRAGKDIVLPLQLRNTAGSAAQTINLRLTELSQDEATGSWRSIEPGSDEDLSNHPSCLAWVQLTNTELEIAPLRPSVVNVRIDPPQNARGTYFACIIAEPAVQEEGAGIKVRMRFVVPIILEIEGKPVRQQVNLEDNLLRLVTDEEQKKPLTTEAKLLIKNNGLTFSRIRGKMSVERQAGERWRPVTRFDVEETGIIPGIALRLGKDLERRLPSGTYRLRGELYVDGRRVQPLEKIIEFEGDPNADAMKYDAAMMIEPEFVTLDLAPGATRTKAIVLENPGEEPVTVSLEMRVPRGLGGVEMGDIKGTDLLAQPFLEFQPQQMTLNPGRKQNVQLMARLPQEGAIHGHYFVNLQVKGQYGDGQSAGQTQALIHLGNTAIPSKPRVTLEQFSLADGEQDSHYVVRTRLANTGNVHFIPQARVVILNSQGTEVRDLSLTGDEGLLLPLTKRTFSGEISFERMPPDFYSLRLEIENGFDAPLSKQVVIRVDVEGTLEDPEEESKLPRRVFIVNPDEVPEAKPETQSGAAASADTEIPAAAPPSASAVPSAGPPPPAEEVPSNPEPTETTL